MKDNRYARKHSRKAVTLPVILTVNGVVHPGTAFDISLGGVRVKSNAIFKNDDNVSVTINGTFKQSVKVVWNAQGFSGLDFMGDPDEIKKELARISANLN
ncbi:PilZ domain-containing protein [Pseudemcibacter aquimaris]|nr:PilZ domain-containing protein [Pseudemcibacter aquimaris]WDU58148.1 PilZ domain-containing protein [Pseudemcibacter aquimaris]